MDHEVVRRGFVGVEEGQIHYRTCGRPDAPPLVMLHGSPLSSYSVMSLMKEMGKQFRVIAPDTLGNGDSSAPTKFPVDFPYLAGAMMRAMANLGLKEFPIYGYHTGGNVGIEAALAHPGRVQRLILEGVGLYSAEERAAMLANQAPEIVCDLEGTQLLRAWHLLRDGKIFWPWWNRTADGARKSGLPSPDEMHNQLVEMLKSIRTYHHSYRASFAYNKLERLKLLKLPVLVAAAGQDPLLPYLQEAASQIPQGQHAAIGDVSTLEGRTEIARTYTTFLNRQ